MNLTMEALYLFFIYAFLGWVVEVAFHVLTVGKFINRGFLKGPYCPIYGFGMIFILYLLTPYMSNLLILFLMFMLITTLIELVGGYVLEHFLHKRWWDYSDLPFNFKGYICLKFSIYWGMGALFVVKFIHPVVDNLFKYIPHIITYIFVIIMLVMMIVDFVTTLNSILGLNRELKELNELESKILKLSDEMGEKITERVIKSQENKEKLEELFEERLKKLSKKHRRIIKAFPNMKSKRESNILEKVKERVNKK